MKVQYDIVHIVTAINRWFIDILINFVFLKAILMIGDPNNWSSFVHCYNIRDGSIPIPNSLQTNRTLKSPAEHQFFNSDSLAET